MEAGTEWLRVSFPLQYNIIARYDNAHQEICPQIPSACQDFSLA